MPASLENQFISDLYTSLLHLSGAQLGNAVNQVYDGVGNRTGIALSGKDPDTGIDPIPGHAQSQVIINGYVQPIGFTDEKPKPWLDAFFPIGVIHLSINNENPGERIAGTTWKQVAQGKFIVGVGVGTDRNSVSKEFGAEDSGPGNEEGEYSHVLTENELASHGHEANILSGPALMPSDAGTAVEGQEFQAGLATTVTTEYQAQLEVLIELNNWGQRNYRDTGTTDQTRARDAQALKYLDPTGQLGSAADYSPELITELKRVHPQNRFMKDEFKEVQGIWNGQTRYLDTNMVNPRGDLDGDRGTQLHDKKGYSIYTKALALGAGKGPGGNNLVVDVGSRPLGIPIGTVTESVPTVERIEGSENFSTTDNTGKSENHNNISPAYGVYVWKRTA